MDVLAFHRDWTSDLNPHPDRAAIPLAWVKHWAHETGHEVWAIGNQDLVYETGIPGVVEAVQRHHGSLDVLGERDETGDYEWWPPRERRLELLAELFPDKRRYIVIDELDLSHVDGWDHYTAWEFRNEIENNTLDAYFPLPAADTDDETGTGRYSGDVQTTLQSLQTAEVVDVTVDEGEEGFRSSEWQRVRPSALPIDAPPTVDFETQAGEIRRVELPGITELTVVETDADAVEAEKAKERSRVDHPDIDVMLGRATYANAFTSQQRVQFAVDVLRTATRYQALPHKLMNEFAAAVDDVPDSDSKPVVRAGSYLAQQPSLLHHVGDDLRTLADISDSPVRQQAVRCLMELAEEAPEHALDVVPTLSVALESDDAMTRSYATYAFTCLSKHYPEELFPALETLLDRVEDDDQTTRTNALSAVGHVVSEYPDAGVDVADSIAGLLSSDNKRVRNNAAGLLGDIAQEHPDVVVDYADHLAERLDDPNIQARINASIALLRASEANPDRIRDQRASLERALEEASPDVRANVCALIANAKVEVSIDTLHDLRANDPDETVRDHADWAIQRLPSED